MRSDPRFTEPEFTGDKADGREIGEPSGYTNGAMASRKYAEPRKAGDEVKPC